MMVKEAQSLVICPVFVILDVEDSQNARSCRQIRAKQLDAQAAGYARFEKSLGQVRFGSKMFGLKVLAYLHSCILLY